MAGRTLQKMTIAHHSTIALPHKIMTTKHHNCTRPTLPAELLARLQLPRLKNTQRRYADMVDAANRLGIAIDHTEHPADCWWQRVEAAIDEMTGGAYDQEAA